MPFMSFYYLGVLFCRAVRQCQRWLHRADISYTRFFHSMVSLHMSRYRIDNIKREWRWAETNKTSSSLLSYLLYCLLIQNILAKFYKCRSYLTLCSLIYPSTTIGSICIQVSLPFLLIVFSILFHVDERWC